MRTWQLWSGWRRSPVATARSARATLTAISNSRKGSGDNREDEPTAIQWTLWDKLAESAAQYLGKGSHVNVTGRLRNNHYTDGKGNTVFGFSFTCEEIDYLDSRAESEARRAFQDNQHEEASPTPAVPAADNDIPFCTPTGAGRRAPRLVTGR